MFKHSLVNKILGLNLVILITAFSLFIILSATGKEKNIAGIIFIALVSILSTAIVIRLALKRIVADPVRDVIRHIKDVGSGSFDKLVDVRSSDEIGELAAGFNQMTQSLSRSCQELEQWKKELESRVNDRTKELQDTQVHLIQTEKLAATGKLAAGVAHEINNPIGIILNRIECLEMEAAEKKIGKEIMKDLKVISEHAKRVSKIVGGLLAFSRQTSGDSKFQQMNINDILEKGVALFDRIALQKGVQIEKRLSNSLPPILGDFQKLEQAMLNLIDNALDATERGGRIIVESRKKFRNDYFVQILVSDTGCGIPKENLDKIFDPFFTTKDVGKGTGLGLAVSYGIIKEHHGKIEVKSDKGKG